MHLLLLRLAVILALGLVVLSRPGIVCACRVWEHLATYWEAPGSVLSISADGEHAIIISDGIERLVRIRTGEVLFEQNSQKYPSMSFSPSGAFVVWPSGYSVTSGRSTTPGSFRIESLRTGSGVTVTGKFDEFSDDERTVVAFQRYGHESRLVDSRTGEILAKYAGNAVLSRNGQWIAVTNLSQGFRWTTTVIERETGTVLRVLEYPPIADYPAGLFFGRWAYTRFHGGDRYMSILLVDRIMIVSTATWEIAYTLRTGGGVGFTRDGRFAFTLNDDGYSRVQFLRAADGLVLDEVLGSFRTDANGRFLIRALALTYDFDEVQIVDLDTGATVLQYRTVWGSPRFVNDWLIEQPGFGDRPTRYYDLHSGELLATVPGRTTAYPPVKIVEWKLGNLLLLQEWDTGLLLTSGRSITMSPDERFALVSDGHFVDLYGVPQGEIPNAPPRPSHGVGEIRRTELRLTAIPGTETEPLFDEDYLYNRFDEVSVLGRTEAGDWLYVRAFGRDGLTGWTQSEALDEIISWADVPILSLDDPMSQLRAIAEGHG